MKKPVKITLWVVGSIAFLFIATFLCADIIASYIVKKNVAKIFATMPDAEASVGGIYLNLISGSAIVKDINFCTNSLNLEDSVTNERAPGLAIHVPTLEVWNIHYPELFLERRLVIRNVSVNNAKLLVYLDEDHPETLMPVFPKDTTLEKAQLWLQSVDVFSFDLNRFCARLHSTRTPLRVAVDSLSVGTQKLAYNFCDSTFCYNDSVYTFKLHSLQLTTPDGEFKLEAHDLNNTNQGAVSLGYTRLCNVHSVKHMANIAKEPVTWLDLELNGLSTSSLNPIRKVLAQDCNLDSLQVDVKRLHVCRDARHAPKTPFGTPQEFLGKLPIRFLVKHIQALARSINVEFASTDSNCGQLHLKNARATLTNVTNRPGATWHCMAKAPFGKNGLVNASYDMHMNKSATFDIKINAKDVETEDLDPFIRPLVGITSKCHIDQLDAQYSGDKQIANGTFCLQYHGLDVKVHKEDKIPYEVVTKNADLFTNLAKSLVPKSNPTSVDPAPRQYAVMWKRDEWKPYPLYLFGPCIDGIKMTMLPGLYVHKQVKK